MHATLSLGPKAIQCGSGHILAFAVRAVEVAALW